MCGAVPPLPLYVFMSLTGTTSSLRSTAYLWDVTQCSLVNVIGVSGEQDDITTKLLVLSTGGLQSRLKFSRNRGVCPH